MEGEVRRAGEEGGVRHLRGEQIGEPGLGVRAPACRTIARKVIYSYASINRRVATGMGLLGYALESKGHSVDDMA